MEIPYRELSDEALSAIIEEFITREGTDYGDQEYSLVQKVEQVKRQLQRGEIYVSFDPESQTCQLAPTDSKRPTSPLGSDDSKQDT